MESESPGGTLLILEPKSLRSFTTNDEYLYAMKEDLADWFACLYKIQIEADTFLTILETGVILCRHANEVQHFFNERRRQLQQQQQQQQQADGGQVPLPPLPALAMRSYFIRSVPEGTVTCRVDVKPGTFQARDNVSNFITWCRNLGIPDVLRFETDDLVLRKNEKSVILCLLELARVGAKLGMLAPTIVQMEQEIDEELESGEPPPAAITTHKQIKTCDMKSLDELVRELVGQCSCPVQFPMVKIGEGKYQIGDSRTLIFVRVLRNHVMVRVGGGWDTLENYLDKHDPCRCHFRGHRSGGGTAGPRHQIIRRASTSALVATRSPAAAGTATSNSNNNNQIQIPTSPRRMSSAAAPSTPSSASAHGVSTKGTTSGAGATTSGSGFVKSSSPGPAGFVKGSSPAPGPNKGQHSRSASPVTSGFSKAPSPLRCGSPSPAPGSNGVRRLGHSSSPSPSPSPASSQTLRDSQQSLRESKEILWESRESSSSSHSSTSAGGGGGGGGGGRTQHHQRPSSPSVPNNTSQSLRHSYEQQQQQRQQQQHHHHQQQQQQQRQQQQQHHHHQQQQQQQRQQQQHHHQQQQQQQPGPQHQAVQRCKSPSPGPRCVSPAMSGNRTLPRPVSRGASGIPRPQSPAVAANNSSNSSNGPTSRSSSATGHGARRQLFSNMARSASFDAPTRTDDDDYYYNPEDNYNDRMAATENPSDVMTSRGRCGLSTEGGGQDAEKDALNIDQISTMTLAEFKKLINNNLSVPPTPDEEDGGGVGGGAKGGAQPNDSPRFQRKGVAGQMKRSQSAEASQQSSGGGLSWSSVRDKARSVCNSLASNASSRRGGTASNIIARRNLPKTPTASATPTDFARPKTPSADRPPTAPSSPAVTRSKTPVATSSGYGYRPKTPTSIGEGAQAPNRPKTLGRPKTPTSIGSYARGGGSSAPSPSTPTPSSTSSSVAGFARPKTPSRDVSESWRPKTPTSLSGGSRAPASAAAAAADLNPRVKTTSVVSPADDVEVAEACLRVKTSSFVYSDDSADASNNNNVSDEAAPRNATYRSGMGVRSASWASTPNNNSLENDTSLSLSLPRQRSQSPADDLDEDNSEIAEAMMSMTTASSGSGSSLAASLRERPSTPSRIPKPTFTRSATPSGSADAATKSTIPTGRSTPGAQQQQSAPRPQPRATTPLGKSSLERQLTAPAEVGGGDNSEKPPPITPRRSAQVPRCATASSSKSYTEMFHARRSQTPGPGSSSSSTTTATARPTTPGPGTSSGGLRGGQQQQQQQQQQSAGRRGSLGRVLVGGSQPLRKARSVTNLLQDSEFSVLDTGDRCGGEGGGAGVRSSSQEAQRRLQRQNATDADREVTMTVTRGRQGQHSVQVTDHNRNVTYTPRNPSRVSQSASFDNSNERARSKTPGPGVGNGVGGSRYTQQPRGIIRKPNPSSLKSGDGGSRAINRTEAWVDSTLNDPKRKQTPPRPRRAMTPNSLAIAESELKSRPLEEIQAALSSPLELDPEAVAPPPEDPDMFRKMEQLFEKYREMELRASVYDTPGGDVELDNNAPTAITTSSGSNSSLSRSTNNSHAGGGGSRPGGQVCYNSASSSLRSSMTHSGSFSSGLSSSARSHQDTGSGSYSSRGPSVDSDRFSKESSPAAAASSSLCGNGAASYSGNGDLLHHHQLNGTGDDSGCVTSVTPRPGQQQQQQQQGAPAVSAEDIVDLDPETLASDPTALVSKIKEILQVRPRKDTPGKGSGTRTRIPAPAAAPLSRYKRSKSVSSLTNGETMSVFVDQSPSSSSTNTTPNGLLVDVTRDESTNSDVSSEYSRCETPVPKLAQPLTTGRSTLFRRGGGGGGGGRSLSQDDHVSSSSSLSSSSRRYWDEDGEYV